MRAYVEPTARNLLRRPLVLGVPFTGLLFIAATVLGAEILVPRPWSDAIAGAFGLIGYVALRLLSRFSKPGWEEALIYFVERLCRRKDRAGELRFQRSSFRLLSPDTLDPGEQLLEKEEVAEGLRSLRHGETWRFRAVIGPTGATLERYSFPGGRRKDWKALWNKTFGLKYAYSLYRLPVVTDPLWLFAHLNRLGVPVQVLVSVRGSDFHSSKRQIEHSRRRNARDSGAISNVDSEVTFEEASSVLRGLSRGDEALVELSCVIAADQKLDLDPQLFCEEKSLDLAFHSISGMRKRFHRSHLVRLATAADLLPTFVDPKEAGAPILKSLRGNDLYFSPQDARLEALHWLVVGASGSGKSFFTGVVLKRMLEHKTQMSVLFVDHNRSFRRFVKASEATYFEPSELGGFDRRCSEVIDALNVVGAVSGIELSDLMLEEKKEATHSLLSRVERFLRSRTSTHPVYVVLDECWNFLRDEPVLVQRAFREFRKLNGAVVAITQSLSDFVTDESGRSIFQNAPIRILLRQGEDLGDFRGTLGLNDTEYSRLRALRQSRGEFSECLIKTPFLSRIGRLYPTEEEHRLFRTDNLREELIAEARRERKCVL